MRRILSTEVVSPLADAMRLVHREEGDVEPGEDLRKVLVREPLGRDIDELVGAREQFLDATGRT